MIGSTVGHYKIISKLGGGDGRGVVCKARDQKLDRTVAPKFLPVHVGQEPERQLRFLREPPDAVIARGPLPIDAVTHIARQV